MRRLAVQEADFDAGVELARLGGGQAGGVASFIGIVRAGGDPDRRVAALTLEHYPGMTEAAIERIVAQAEARWELTGCTVIHRVGRLLAGETIVFVAAASAHRGDALQATAFLIDWLKTGAPFWKVEELESGAREWVEARTADDEAAASWTK